MGIMLAMKMDKIWLCLLVLEKELISYRGCIYPLGRLLSIQVQHFLFFFDFEALSENHMFVRLTE